MGAPVDVAALLPPPSAYAVQAEVVATGSGLRVVLAPDAARRELVAEWVFDNGARDDPPGKHGLAHLVEHLSFGALEPGGPDYDERLGRIGGESHGWTDRERSGLGATVPSGDGAFAGLLELEAARWRGVVVDEVALAAQLRVLASEAAEAQSGAHALDKFELDALLWGSGTGWSRHPQAPIAPGLGVDDVRQAWPRLRDPARSVLVLAGPLPPDASAQVRGAFAAAAGASPAPGPAAVASPCEPGPTARAWRRGDVAEGAVYFAWPGPPRDNGDRVALEAIGRWLGGTRVTSGRDCGAVVVERRGGAARAAQHASRLARTLRALGRYGMPASALHAARAGQLTDLARARASLPLRARILAGCLLATGAPGCLEGEAEAWGRLGVDDTRRAAARWLDFDTVTLLAILSPSTLLPPAIPGIRWRP